MGELSWRFSNIAQQLTYSHYWYILQERLARSREQRKQHKYDSTICKYDRQDVGKTHGSGQNAKLKTELVPDCNAGSDVFEE